MRVILRKALFGGSNFAVHVWRENMSARELFKIYLAGTFSKNHLAGTFKNTFGGNNFMAEKFEILLFKNKGSETQP